MGGRRVGGGGMTEAGLLNSQRGGGGGAEGVGAAVAGRAGLCLTPSSSAGIVPSAPACREVGRLSGLGCV